MQKEVSVITPIYNFMIFFQWRKIPIDIPCVGGLNFLENDPVRIEGRWSMSTLHNTYVATSHETFHSFVFFYFIFGLT